MTTRPQPRSGVGSCAFFLVRLFPHERTSNSILCSDPRSVLGSSFPAHLATGTEVRSRRLKMEKYQGVGGVLETRFSRGVGVVCWVYRALLPYKISFLRRHLLCSPIRAALHAPLLGAREFVGAESQFGMYPGRTLILGGFCGREVLVPSALGSGPVVFGFRCLPPPQDTKQKSPFSTIHLSSSSTAVFAISALSSFPLPLLSCSGYPAPAVRFAPGLHERKGVAGGKVGRGLFGSGRVGRGLFGGLGHRFRWGAGAKGENRFGDLGPWGGGLS